MVCLFSGDLVLSTPSLDSYRVNKDPMYPFEGGRPQHPPNELDQRVLNYNTLEMRRYQFLRMKQPASRYVSRIFEERCKVKLFSLLMKHPRSL